MAQNSSTTVIAVSSSPASVDFYAHLQQLGRSDSNLHVVSSPWDLSGFFCFLQQIILLLQSVFQFLQLVILLLQQIILLLKRTILFLQQIILLLQQIILLSQRIIRLLQKFTLF